MKGPFFIVIIAHGDLPDTFTALSFKVLTLEVSKVLIANVRSISVAIPDNEWLHLLFELRIQY